MAHLEEELGDLLFQVYFHATLAAEEGRFTLADVARGVHDKLVSRHPHVFGDVVAETPDAVAANWEVIKKAEKGRSSVTEGIPAALPALALAAKLQRKARPSGWSFPRWPTRRSGWPTARPGERCRADGADAAPAGWPTAKGARRAPADEVGDLLFAAGRRGPAPRGRPRDGPAWPARPAFRPRSRPGAERVADPAVGRGRRPRRQGRMPLVPGGPRVVTSGHTANRSDGAQ